MRIDKPLTSKEILEDENERERIRLLLSTINTLVNSNQHGSISVSVNGDWGSGKTTYLKVIESYFRDFCRFPVVFYEAWKYQEDEKPLIPLILEIREIPDIKPAIKGRLSKILKPILAAGITLSDMLLNSITGKGIESIEKSFNLIEKEQLALVSKYRNNLKLLSDTIMEIKDNYKANEERLVYKDKWTEISGGLPLLNGKKLFVLIIDDLDRLLAKEAFRVIETLRFYFDIDDVLIIMGINDEILNNYIMEHYGVKDDKRGEKFLEKIFHWNYELSYTELNSLHLRDIVKVVKDKKNIDKIKNILSRIDLLTHRKWIKIINRIEKKVILQGSDYRDVLERLIFSAVMKELFPQFELFSRRFPNVLEELYMEGGTEDILKEAEKKIKEDKSYLYFPERNYSIIKEATKSKKTDELNVTLKGL